MVLENSNRQLLRKMKKMVRHADPPPLCRHSVSSLGAQVELISRIGAGCTYTNILTADKDKRKYIQGYTKSNRRKGDLYLKHTDMATSR